MSEQEFAEIVYRALLMIVRALEKRYLFGPCAPGKAVVVQPTDSMTS